MPGKDSRQIFAKIRTFATWVSCGTRAEDKLYVFDALCVRQSTPARAPRRARGHPSPCHRRPASPAFPNPVQPAEKTVHVSVKLPERGIGLYFTGEASPRSPEFNRPPATVDRGTQ